MNFLRYKFGTVVAFFQIKIERRQPMNGVYSWCYGWVSVREAISKLSSNIGYQIKMEVFVGHGINDYNLTPINTSLIGQYAADDR